MKPSVVVTARALNYEKNQQTAATGIKVITVPENRWPRVDIKSVSLLPNVLAKQEAREKGAYEAWYVGSDGFVTEGASSNAWIVTKDGRVVTRSADQRYSCRHHPGRSHGGHGRPFRSGWRNVRSRRRKPTRLRRLS